MTYDKTLDTEPLEYSEIAIVIVVVVSILFAVLLGFTCAGFHLRDRTSLEKVGVFLIVIDSLAGFLGIGFWGIHLYAKAKQRTQALLQRVKRLERMGDR